MEQLNFVEFSKKISFSIKDFYEILKLFIEVTNKNFDKCTIESFWIFLVLFKLPPFFHLFWIFQSNTGGVSFLDARN